jgi:hypothetical protein
MEVTLRKASALSNALLDVARKIQASASVSLSIYDKNAPQTIERARADFIAKLARAKAAFYAAYAIRKEIGKANARTDINVLLAEREVSDAHEKLVSPFANAPVQSTLEQIDSEMSVARERVKTQHYGSEVVAVSLLNETMRDDYRRYAESLRRNKVRIADKLLEINTSTKLVLPTEIEDVLRAEGIIE